MKTLNRNCKTVYYKDFTNKTEVVVDGVRTGEFQLTYGSLKSVQCNVGPNNGRINFEPFGISNESTRVLVTTDLGCTIGPGSIIWVDASTSGAADYELAAPPIKTLNSIQFLISKMPD